MALLRDHFARGRFSRKPLLDTSLCSFQVGFVPQNAIRSSGRVITKPLLMSMVTPTGTGRLSAYSPAGFIWRAARNFAENGRRKLRRQSTDVTDGHRWSEREPFRPLPICARLRHLWIVSSVCEIRRTAGIIRRCRRWPQMVGTETLGPLLICANRCNLWIVSWLCPTRRTARIIRRCRRWPQMLGTRTLPASSYLRTSASSADSFLAVSDPENGKDHPQMSPMATDGRNENP